jgi:hypothetical protein
MTPVNKLAYIAELRESLKRARTCGECRHWLGLAAEPHHTVLEGHYICLAITRASVLPHVPNRTRRVLARGLDGQEAQVFTRRDFGCTLWQKSEPDSEAAGTKGLP